MVKQRTEYRVADDGFDSLYRRELPSLVALAATLTGSRESGAEIAQEALLRAYRDWPNVGALERPGAWVRRATLNLAIDAHRRRVREISALSRFPEDEPISDGAIGFGVNDPLWVAVRALPERQRAVVALFYLQDLSLDEIAGTLEMSVGTAKSTLFSARKSLAQTLGAQEVTE